MKCPYTVNIEQVSQYTYAYDDGNNTFTQNKLIELKTFVDCLQEECAVLADSIETILQH